VNGVGVSVGRGVGVRGISASSVPAVEGVVVGELYGVSCKLMGVAVAVSRDNSGVQAVAARIRPNNKGVYQQRKWKNIAAIIPQWYRLTDF